jgi:hypothetical protein
MGKLVEQTLRTMYQGVSRQPSTVRLPGQVEEAENVLFSVVSGGFSKRPGTQFITAAAQADGETAFHSYERDSAEKYLILITNGVIGVYDGSGTAMTVTYTDSLAYLQSSNPSTDMSFSTIGDTTFISNKSIIVTMSVEGVFDASTMPHQIVRNADGTFTYQQCSTYNPRITTDPAFTATDLVPTPEFVGHGIADITMHRNRLSFVADETVYFSTSGDYTNFWPKTVGQVIDSDPFGRTASSASVNKLRYVVPFRKALFCSADMAQFELSAANALTPTDTTIDIATQYTAEAGCRPIGFRDELYFASRSGDSAVMFEYYYSDTSVGHTANDVLIHASGYIPAPITRLVSDTVTGTILALSGNDRSSIYVYRTFWNGEEKAQSAWCKWTFGTDTVIRNLTNLGGEIYLLLTRGSIMSIEKMSLNGDDKPSNFKYPVRLDGLQLLNGVYDSTDNRTTYTSAYTVTETMQGITDTLTTDQSRSGIRVDPLTVTGSEFTVFGDTTLEPIYFGIPYPMNVELSKQYLREADNETITTGRLQLKRLYLDYKDSAFLQVEVTPYKRTTKTYTFNGSATGQSIQASPDLSSGTFDTPIRTEGSSATIKITNNSYLPCTVTSARWVGFFNEMTRQE